MTRKEMPGTVLSFIIAEYWQVRDVEIHFLRLQENAQLFF